MEINKQLFEDVLSGKLKGTFVLRNKQIVKSNTLKRSSNDNFPYEILIKYDDEKIDYGIYKSNGDFETFNTSNFDIINFIPDTDMKENELTIEIPYGKEIDWDESKKQNKIVLKDKQLTYKDVCEKLFSKPCTYYFLNEHGTISTASSIYCGPYMSDPNSATTAHQLECILAKNQLANIAKYLNDGWKPFDDQNVVILIKVKNGVFPESITQGSAAADSTIWFKSKELAKQAIEILGEETVELALEPLGI